MSALPPPRTVGERWAREELERLRAARFAPGAVGAFLAESQRRANELRAERPRQAAQVRLVAATGAGAWLLLGGARGPAAMRAARRGGLAWWALVAVMLDWHIGMFETEDGEPRPLGPADALTLTRAWLVPVAATDPTPLVVLLGAGTDVLDGIVARATAPTRAGRDLEGLVDAAFLAAVLRGMRRTERLGRGAAALEGARQAAGVGYAVGVWFGRAAPPDAALLGAARALSTARVAALVLAGAGRRPGDARVAALVRAGAGRRPGDARAHGLRGRVAGLLLAGSSLGALAALGRHRALTADGMSI